MENIDIKNSFLPTSYQEDIITITNKGMKDRMIESLEARSEAIGLILGVKRIIIRGETKRGP